MIRSKSGLCRSRKASSSSPAKQRLITKHECDASGLPLHMLGLHPTLQVCWGPLGSTLRRSFSRPDASHSAGLVIISSNSVESPLDCKRMEMFIIIAQWDYLKDRRDKNRISIRQTEECCLRRLCGLQVRDTTDHCRVLIDYSTVFPQRRGWCIQRAWFWEHVRFVLWCLRGREAHSKIALFRKKFRVEYHKTDAFPMGYLTLDQSIGLHSRDFSFFCGCQERSLQRSSGQCPDQPSTW